MPYRTPKWVQEKKDAKRAQILEVALHLFAEKGFPNTSIQDICEAAKVSVGSIYFYFANKESIYEAVYQMINEEYENKMVNALRGLSDIRDIIRKLIEVTVRHSLPDVSRSQFFIMNRSLSDLKSKRDTSLKASVPFVQDLLDKALIKGEIAPINTKMAAVSFIYGTYQVLRYWNMYENAISGDEMIEFLYNYHVPGLGLVK
ncbi:TetR/AcrR family transcriptional regulator [Desulfosporosinus sp. OT]|uniref:TetR/AcrR family transcriptional regulator n=1 Tax=Desulfosporosinus sp. OT TaxID=913865 RepID=UPI0002239C4F|nr:TetR/AcrR family transcriptional regulator [Desulfosporosinus sp. OT]EGW41487.1 bacterial regulatory s, tetR family protein [Desulfosporosinus sp. OT]